MTILTLRAGTLGCFTPHLKLTAADLKEVEDTRNPDALQRGGNTLVDRLYGAQRLAAKQWLHALHHSADAMTQVRSFVQLLDAATAQDAHNFICSLLNDDMVELKIVSHDSDAPIACVTVSRLGNFTLRADPANDAHALLTFGDAHAPLIEISLAMTERLRQALRFEPACERLLGFFDRATSEPANAIDMRRFCEAVIAHLENDDKVFDVDATVMPIAVSSVADGVGPLRDAELLTLETRIREACASETLVADLAFIKSHAAITAQVCREAKNKLRQSASADVYKTTAHDFFKKNRILYLDKGNFTHVRFSNVSEKIKTSKTKLRISIDLLWLGASDTSHYVMGLFAYIRQSLPAIVLAKTNNIMLTGLRKPGYADHTFVNKQITMYVRDGTLPCDITRIAHQLEKLTHSAFGSYHICQDIGSDVAIEGCRYVTQRVETVTRHGFDMAKFVQAHRADLFTNAEKQNLKLAEDNPIFTNKPRLLLTSFDTQPGDNKTFEDLLVYNLVKMADYSDIVDAAALEARLVKFFS